jgi:hypothetical protein
MSMDWLKTIYEAIGTPHPRASLLAATVLGAIIFGSGWWFIGKAVEKERLNPRPTTTTPVTAPTVTGPASTTGSQSPAITGNDNKVEYDKPADKPKPQPKE